MAKILFLILLFPIFINSQTWFMENHYDGQNHLNDQPFAMSGNNNINGISIVGNTNNGTNTDYFISRYDLTNSTWWTIAFDGTYGNDIAADVYLNNQGSIFVTGATLGNSDFDITTVSYDYSGNFRWKNTWNNNGQNTDNEGIYIVEDQTGNIYVTGYIDPHITIPKPKQNDDLPSMDIVTLKINSDGSTNTTNWPQIFNGSGNGPDKPIKILTDNNGYFYIGGSTYSASTNNDFLIIKYNAIGEQIWFRTYNYGGLTVTGELAKAMDMDNLGNIYLTGLEADQSNSNINMLTVKYNSDGVFQWANLYDGPSHNFDGATSVISSTSGDVYVSGVSFLSSEDIVTIKYNSNGSQQWVAIYNNNNDYEESKSIAINNNHIFVVGKTFNTSTLWDFILLEYDEQGNEILHSTYDAGSNGDDSTRSVTVVNNKMFITGTTTNSAGNLDITTLGCDLLTNKSFSLTSTKLGNTIHKEFNLSQNYPNPFNPVTKIKFEIPAESNVNITIYNILGKEISIVVNERLASGSYEVNWDATNYPSGVYLCKLISDNYTASRKMVLIK